MHIHCTLYICTMNMCIHIYMHTCILCTQSKQLYTKGRVYAFSMHCLTACRRQWPMTVAVAVAAAAVAVAWAGDTDELRMIGNEHHSSEREYLYYMERLPMVKDCIIKEGELERERERARARERERERERETYKQTDKQRETEEETETDR